MLAASWSHQQRQRHQPPANVQSFTAVSPVQHHHHTRTGPSPEDHLHHQVVITIPSTQIHHRSGGCELSQQQDPSTISLSIPQVTVARHIPVTAITAPVCAAQLAWRGTSGVRAQCVRRSRSSAQLHLHTSSVQCHHPLALRPAPTTTEAVPVCPAPSQAQMRTAPSLQPPRACPPRRAGTTLAVCSTTPAPQPPIGGAEPPPPSTGEARRHPQSHAAAGTPPSPWPLPCLPAASPCLPPSWRQGTLSHPHPGRRVRVRVQPPMAAAWHATTTPCHQPQHPLPHRRPSPPIALHRQPPPWDLHAPRPPPPAAPSHGLPPRAAGAPPRHSHRGGTASEEGLMATFATPTRTR